MIKSKAIPTVWSGIIISAVLIWGSSSQVTYVIVDCSTSKSDLFCANAFQAPPNSCCAIVKTLDNSLNTLATNYYCLP